METKRKKTAIISPERIRVIGLVEMLLQIVPEMGSYWADSLAVARTKITNDPPDILILDAEPFSVDWVKLVNWFLANPEGKKVGIVILSTIPKAGVFVDEVMTGQIQFLEPLSTEGSIRDCFRRTLDFINPETRANDLRIRSLSVGEKLIAQGEAASSVFILKSGRLEATRKDESGALITLGQVLPGEFVGEMAYINGEPRSANVVANEQSEVVEIPVGTIDRILLQKPQWARAMIKTLARRLKEASMK